MFSHLKLLRVAILVMPGFSSREQALCKPSLLRLCHGNGVQGLIFEITNISRNTLDGDNDGFQLNVPLVLSSNNC
jgi:hypothetical protein